MSSKVEEALQALLDSGQPFSLDDLAQVAVATGGYPWDGKLALEKWQEQKLVRAGNHPGTRSRKTLWKKGTPR